MALSRDPTHTRVPSLLSISNSTPAARSEEDLTRPSLRGLRPSAVPREPKTKSHHHTPSIELHASSPAQQAGGWSSRDASPRGTGRTPNGGLRSSSSAQNLRLTQSPTLTPIHASQAVQSPSYTPLYPHQVNRSLTGSPAGTPSFGPQARDLLGSQGDDVLLPPPRLSDARSEHSSSPTESRPGSRAEADSRGRQGSQGLATPRSRTQSPGLGGELGRPPTPMEGRISKKKSWIPGKSHNKTNSVSSLDQGPQAWVVGPQGKASYDISCLLKAQPIPELWDEFGNTFVHLFPRDAGLGPSFKIHSNLITSSRILNLLAWGNTQTPTHSRESSLSQNVPSHFRQTSLGALPGLPNTPVSLEKPRSASSDATLLGWPGSAYTNDEINEERPGDIHLYIPLGVSPHAFVSGFSPEEIENLVATRNLFAFLIGQLLVGTPKCPTIFSIFLKIATLLDVYDFSSADGSSFGDVALASFIGYTGDLRLDDVRASREKTIEAIVLGERMKSWSIYNEGFVHGVGKWDELLQMNSPLLPMISAITRNRMEKASLDLSIRLRNIRTRLDDFDIPSLFTGVAAVNTKEVDFKGWKNSFLAMRKYTMTLYKSRYGSWPPKAKSKKNSFEESGLNRVLLQEVYQDFSDLYDMLVDRVSPTTRLADLPTSPQSSKLDPHTEALRKLMKEFDQSSPPVQPPVPFDIPQLPNLTKTRRDFESLPIKKQMKERAKKLKDDEINLALMQSYNRDAIKVTPFTETFMSFERSSAKGKSIEEMVDLRIGQWMFLYIVLQSLPMVVIDASGIRWASGVEYFLCEIPIGAPPWAKDDSRGIKKAYYRVGNGSGIVNLPSDVVDHGVEGIYRRSHCWLAADDWYGHHPASEPTPKPACPLDLSTPPTSKGSVFSPISKIDPYAPRLSTFSFMSPTSPQPISDLIGSDQGPSSRSSSQDRTSPRTSREMDRQSELKPMPSPSSLSQSMVSSGLASARRHSQSRSPTRPPKLPLQQEMGASLPGSLTTGMPTPVRTPGVQLRDNGTIKPPPIPIQQARGSTSSSLPTPGPAKTPGAGKSFEDILGPATPTVKKRK